MIEVNVITLILVSIKPKRRLWNEAAIFIQTIPILINDSVARAVSSSIVYDINCSNSSVENMNLVFCREGGDGTKVASVNELFDENLVDARSKLQLDVGKSLGQSRNEINSAEAIREYEDSLSRMASCYADGKS
jgi:hypothetical protein